MAFTHRDLDGTWAKLLGPAILECRDVNDGQSPDPADKHRFQYTLCNGVIYMRRLPAVAYGDCYRGERHPPDWESMPEWPEHFALLREWCLYLWNGHGPQPYVAPAGLRIRSRKSCMLVDASYWPQCIPCPHCSDWIVWWEAGYVPGWRRCVGCHRHWRVVHSERIDETTRREPIVWRWRLERQRI